MTDRVPSQWPATLASLPVELVRQIVLATFERPTNQAGVSRSGHFRTLTSLCLVSKTFNAVATEYLYRDLDVDDFPTAALLFRTAHSDRWANGALAGQLAHMAQTISFGDTASGVVSTSFQGGDGEDEGGPLSGFVRRVLQVVGELGSVSITNLVVECSAFNYMPSE